MQHEVRLSLVCTTTLYKFDICKLLNSGKTEQEKEQIRIQFNEIASKFFTSNEQNLKHISASWPKICWAYFISWIPFFGHCNILHKWTAKEVHDDLINNKAKTMLCSEFVARSLIACIYELEESCKSMPGNDSTEPLFKVPFSETERLSTIFSSRLVNIMENSKCFTKHNWHTAVPQA